MAKIVEGGGVVRAVAAPKTAEKSQSPDPGDAIDLVVSTVSAPPTCTR